MAEPTYIFRNGNVYTLVEGKVIASVKEAEFNPGESHPIEGDIQMPPPPQGLEGQGEGTTCPTCGSPTSAQDQFCPNCGEALAGNAYSEPPGYSGENLPEFAPYTGKVVTTPNGLKGRVLARTPALWGDEVTVRFENGVIKKIPVDQNLTFTAAEEAPEGQTSVERLEERLASRADSDKESLVKRASDLLKVKRQIIALVPQSSDEDAAKLDRMSVEADYELREIKETLDFRASEEVEAFEAPAPIENMPTVEQAHTGGSDANWLDRTIREAVAEANATDYEKLMDEGPEVFVAGLEDAQLADAGTTRVMASREIRSSTVGADEDIRDKYEKIWLARVEEQRQARLSSRKEEVRKEASSDDSPDAPDESLFL